VQTSILRVVSGPKPLERAGLVLPWPLRWSAARAPRKSPFARSADARALYESDPSCLDLMRAGRLPAIGRESTRAVHRSVEGPECASGV